MNNKLFNQTELVRSVRRDFSGMNMKTRAIPDKTKYSRKKKHKNLDSE